MKSFFLHGAIEEIAPQIIPWAEQALYEEQRRAKKRVLRHLRCVEQMVEDLLRSEKPYGVYFDWGGGVSRAYKFETQTSACLGGFYRVGSRAHVGLGVGRVWIAPGHKERHAQRNAYWQVTDGHTPPADTYLLARALANPRRVSAMEKLDLRRRNIQMLAGRVGQPMAREIAKTVGAEEIRLSALQVLRQGSETVVIYEGELEHWFFLPGEVHRLAPMAGVLAEVVLQREKKRWGLTEAARLAVVMGSLEEDY